ncbi:hypothetical protein [Chlorobium limicola]|nr:hypothetical protein [Chlorobium limicola]
MAKGIEFDPFSFNSPEFEGFNRVEIEAVAKTVFKLLTASDAAIKAKLVEFHLIRFVLSVKQWVEKTGSIGIVAKAGYSYSVVNC